jgi:phage-related protein
MGVYSTTSSGTYTMYIEPNFRDETLEVPAYDGRYYYGTQYSAQQFQFNLFADNLSMAEYRNLKTWLKPRNVGKLILSDQPYKYYIVKITSIGALGEIPLTDAQQIDHGVLGDTTEGNVVYTGKFTVTFQTVGSVYGYGLSYYRDDLVYDALNKYGPGVYPENYYYDSGLLYKDMAPALTRTVPANATDFDLTIYNPGSATAIPTVHILSNESYGDNTYIQLDNNTLNTSTVIDLHGLQGPLVIDCEKEIVITKGEEVDKDGNKKEIDIYNYGRFSGNLFEIGEETSVTNLPESFVETIEDFYFRDYDSIYIINDTKGETWAHINPLIMKVSEELIGKYFCINGNGGAKITKIDDEENRLRLDPDVLTYEVLPAEVEEDGTVSRPSGMEFRYIGDFDSKEELPDKGNLGDVASVTYYATSSKGAKIIDKIEMYLYRYNTWAETSLFTEPDEFKDIYGDYKPRYLIFGANIVDVNDIKISTNIGECDVSISFLPRYL